MGKVRRGRMVVGLEVGRFVGCCGGGMVVRVLVVLIV